MITSPKVPTDVLWDLSTLFVVLAVIYFAAIFFFRSKFKKDAADTAMRKKILAPMVSEFLFYEEHIGSKEEKNSYINRKVEIRELLKDKKNETILSEILLDLKKDVSGETRKLLFKLYKDLNLELKAFDKLKSFKWQKISQGMFELTQMQVLESYGFISRFINDKRSVVRKQAEISTVTLMNEGISYFLDTTKYQISEWQQLKILEVLSNLENFVPPRFAKWLTSKNKHVVLFSLRLIKHYDQNDAEESVIALVRHKNTNIKHEAIGCIKKFNFISARSTLKAVFWGNNVHIKLAILDALANFENVEDIPFLESVEKLESNFTVKSKALSSINTIHPEYVMPTVDLEKVIIEAIKPDSIVDAKTEGGITPDIESTLIENEEIIEDLETENSTEPLVSKVISFEELDLNLELEKVSKFSEQEMFDKAEESLEHESLVDALNSVLKEEPIAKTEIEPEIESIREPQKSLSKSESIEVESFANFEENNVILPDSYSSIFKSLFEVADDDCKLILLDEILEIGDYKEISFLASLHNHHNAEIRNKALIVKTKLQEKATVVLDQELTIKQEEEEIKPEIINNDSQYDLVKENPNFEKKENNDVIKENSDGLMPLEFCFLLDELEINKAKPFDLFEIEFSPEFSKSISLLNENDISDEEFSRLHGLTPEENNYFQQLLEFPLTIKNKYNG